MYSNFILSPNPGITQLRWLPSSIRIPKNERLKARVMNYGYIGYFENEKEYYRQLFELRKQGCQIIYTEDLLTENDQNSKLNKLCNELLEGDTVVIWKIDQLGATQSKQVARLIELGIKKVKIKSIYENVDTSSDLGYEITTITNA